MLLKEVLEDLKDAKLKVTRLHLYLFRIEHKAQRKTMKILVIMKEDTIRLQIRRE